MTLLCCCESIVPLYVCPSDSKTMDPLVPRNSAWSIARSLEQPLTFAIYMSPIILFADTSLHKLEIGKGPMLEVSILL
jgi:hypothetical protein